MALGAFFSIGFNAKRLFAIVAGAAFLAGLHIGHLMFAFLHLEDFGMAIGAFKTRIGVGFAIEYDLALSFLIPFYFFPRTYSHSATRKCEGEARCD